MSGLRYPRRFHIWYDNGDEGYSVHPVTARSSLEAGLEFMASRPGVEMWDVIETGKREIKFTLDTRRQFMAPY